MKFKLYTFKNNSWRKLEHITKEYYKTRLSDAFAFNTYLYNMRSKGEKTTFSQIMLIPLTRTHTSQGQS